MKKIIAIQGYKNSGKDTVSEMLQYLLNTPKWMHKYKIYVLLKDLLIYSENKFQIVRYADRLKKMLSVLLNVDEKKFEDRKFKEEVFVCFESLSIKHFKKMKSCEFVQILTDNEFNKALKNKNYDTIINNYISIRQLMQYFGTEIMRSHFGNKLWILATLNNEYENIIVADQRFLIEMYESLKKNAILIHVERPGCVAGNHASEKELELAEQNQWYSYKINNNNKLNHLFKECKILYNLIKENRLDNYTDPEILNETFNKYIKLW